MALVGTVVSITGIAYLVAENGERRELKLGDQVQTGDAIQTPRGVEVELELTTGRLINIHSEQLVQFTEELTAAIEPSNVDSAVNLATIETVIKAIEEGKDINAVLEETAAGQSGQYNSYGFNFVDLFKITDILNAFNFAFDYQIGQRVDTSPVVDGDDITYSGLLIDNPQTPGVISPVNNAPTAVNVTANGLEDATSIAITLSGTDVDGTIASITVNTLPANGLLYVDAALATLVVAGATYLGSSATFYFVPDANSNGNASFAYIVTDNLGLNSATATATIAVAAVNDAPAINDENIGVTEDTPATGNVLANDTDVDGNPLSVTQFTVDIDGNGSPEVFVTGTTATIIGVGTIVINANGDFTFTPAPNYAGPVPPVIYTVSDGSLTATGSLNLGPITPVNDAPIAVNDSITIDEDTSYTSVVSLIANDTDVDHPVLTAVAGTYTTTQGGSITIAADGSYTYTPLLNFNGIDTVNYTVTGGTLTDIGTLSITVNPVNDAPIAVNDSITIDEDTPYTSAVSLIANDTDVDNPILTAVAGTYATTQGGSITIAADGSYTYTPLLNFNGVDTVNYTVTDGTLTDIGTLSITVNPINDAPVAMDDVATTSINTPIDINVKANDIDVDNTTAQLTVSNPILTNSAQGTVSVNLDGTLHFEPAFNVFGSVEITYTLTDPAGLSDTATLTVNVGNNTPPTGADNVVTINEDALYIFQANDFGFNDVDAGQSFNGIRIDALPLNGTLMLNGSPISTGAVISIIQLNAGQLRFVPVSDANGASYASFTFSVQDNAGGFDATPNTFTLNVTAVTDITNDTVTTYEDTPITFNAITGTNGATPDTFENSARAITSVTQGTNGTVSFLANGNITYTPNPDYFGGDSFTYTVTSGGATETATVNVTVNSVNDAPAGTDKTISTLEDTGYSFSAGDFGFTDPTDNPANSLQSVVITSIPAGSSLRLSGVAVTAGQEISLANIPNLVYTPAANSTASTSFTFQVRDNGGTANSGIDLDPSPNTITLTVTPVNDAPAGTDKTISTLEDTGYSFSAGDFGFTDPTDNPANSLQSVVITSIPAGSSLRLSGVAVTAGQEISLANIPNLVYTPAANSTASTSFTFQVRDNGGTANSGIDLDPSPNTITLTVTPVNDAPAGTDKTISTLEDTGYSFSAGDFGFTDPTDNPANSLQSVVITSIPAGSSLRLSGVAVTAGQEISLANIPNLVYTPAANSTASTSFTFQVRDNGGTANSGIDLDPSPNTITLTVTPVNDAPAGTDKTISTLEDTGYSFSAGDFGFTDPTDNPANSLQSVVITSIPAGSSLRLSGVAVTAGQEISLANIPNLVYTPAANSTASTSFTFQVRDNGGTANSGIDLDPSPNTITLTVTPVNDAPAGTDKTISTLEDTGYSFSAGDFGFTDPTDNPANSLQSVVITSIPAGSSLRLSGVAVTAGQEISLANIPNLVYTPAANSTASTSFTFQVRDNGGTANSGIDLDPSPNTITLTVTPVNDAPAGTDKTISTLEDTGYSFSAGDFGFTDPTDNPANSLQSVVITSIPAGSSLRLSGVAVTAGQEISLANIPNLVYTPAANSTASTSFTFQVRDNGGTANSGIDLDPSPNTITLTVTPVNDAPAGTDKTISTLEDTGYSFSAGDFGFTDPTDNPANSLQSVVITSIPAGSSLRLSGVAVTAGQEISLANIPNLVYTPAANSTASTSFTFQVRDNGGTANSGIDLDPSPNTITLTVTPVNDAPAGTDKTISTLEDTGYSFSAGDFGFTDPTDNPANSLQSVVITSIPAGSSLRLSGVAVTAGQEISLANIPNLVYTPAANSTASTSFTFQVRDNGGTANSGIDLDPSPNTITLTVTPVNDAPAGTDKTISTLEDTGYSFSAGDFGFTDPTDNPANSLQSVVITSIPAGSSLRLSGVAVTAGQEISLANIPNLVYTPAANSTASTSFTFQVRDNGGTANSGIDLDPSPNTITLTVTPVNDAPAGTDKTISTLEDTGYSFSAGDFGFTDPTDNPANSLQSVVITSIPAGSSLRLSGVAVTAGQEISLANIPNLVYTPAANSTASTSFTFQVRDNGGTANSGIDLDPSPNTITLTVTPVNDAPAGTDKTISTLEDTGYSFSAGDFGFTDPTDNPANSLQSVVITSIPAGSSLRLSGVAVTAGQEISLANIPNLVYTPAANSTASTSFTFQVRDNGGTANSGIDLDPSPNTITLTVTPVNDAPAGTDKTISTLEDTGYSFSAGDFGFTDPTDNPANSLQSVVITSIPAGSSLRLSGVAVTAGQEISLANIPNLVYTPAANSTASTSFTFQVRDNGGTANSGIDLDPSPNTITLTVTPVNDAPAGTDKTISTLEDTGYSFSAGDFGFTDPTDNPANSLQSVVITSIPAGSSLRLSGVAVTAGQEISLANIPNLVYTPAANSTASTSFTFQVRDNGGTANSGIDLDPSPNTITLTVTPVNDAPAGTDKTISTLEDTGYSFSAGDFGFTDPTDNPANSLQSVVITSIPAGSSLRLSGVAVTAGQEISLANIPNLVYTPAANSTASTSFTFQVRDNGGTANSGIDLDPSPNTITLTVTPVNDAPAGTDKTISTLEDTGYSFSAGDFGFTDPTDNPANSLQSVVITSIPAGSSLRLSGVAVTAGQEISLANIPNLVYTPAANSTASTSFTFQVRDNGGTANSGIDLDPSPNTITLTVTPVNDAPAGTDKTISTLEDTGYSFSAGDFGFTDPTDNPANSLQSVVITSIPAGSSLRLSGVAVTAGQEISLANIPNLVYTPAANSTASTSFTFQVRDNGGTANSGIDLDPSPNTITLTVTPVNDAPAGTDKTISTLEDTGYSFSAGDFGFTDPTDNPANSLQSVVITSIPAGSSLRLSGVAVTAGQEISLANIPNLVYTPAANSTASTSFTFQVRDNGGTANSGIDLDPSPNTITLTVTPVNDAPVNTLPASYAATEDTALKLSGLSISDVDAAASPVTVTLGVASGTLTAANAGGVTVTGTGTGSIVLAGTVANINTYLITVANQPTYNPVLNANGPVTLTMVTNDGGNTGSGGALSDTDTSIINIASVNDAPVGVVESFVVTEGATAILGNVLANDTDVDSPSLTVGQFAINVSGTGAQAANGINSITTTLGGTVVMNANGTFTYTAPAFRNHSDATPDTDSFVYRASDGTATSDWTTVSINLTDTGPVAYSDTASLSGGGSISGNVITGTGNIAVGGADVLGADAVSITNVSVTQGTVVSNTVGAGNVRTIVTTNGTLVIDQDDGSYTYTKATDKSVAAGTNTATQSVWTAAGFNTYGYDTPVAAGIYNSPFVGGTPANGINFTSMTAIQAGYVRYRNNGGTGDDGLGVESVVGNSANNKIESNEHLLIDIGLSSQSATITLTDLALLETATWRAYAADGSFISGATGTINGGPLLNTIVSATITTTSPFAYLVLSSTGSNFRIDGLTVTPVAMTTSNIFIYTLTDADGSTSSATLTINPGIAPVIDLDASGVGNGFATAFTQGGAAVSIADTDISITDADSANITKATITLTNAQAGDVLAAGTLPGGITASIVGNVVTLTGSATLANYQTAIRAITFSTTSTNTASRSIDVVVTDGANNSNTATTTVAVSLLNAPVIDLDASNAGTGFTTTYTENGAAVSIADTDISITDVDSANVTGATITLTNAQAGDVLSAGILPGGISSSVVGNVVTLSGVSSLANYQVAIRAITYANSTENPNTTPRIINVVVTDGTSNSNTAITTIAVTAVNDAPVNTVPSAQTTAEDISKAIVGLSISDVDASSSSMTVTLSVTNGTLTVTGGSATITGSGTGTVTLTGAVAAINATLASNVTYLSAPNYYGNDTLTMTTSDNGNTGTGGALIDVDTVNITITSVTDAPQIIMPTSLFSIHAGTPTAAINTTTAITQANIEAALGLPAGSLDNRFDPPVGGANDPGTVDVFDGAYTNYAITLAAGTQVAFDWSFFNGELVLSEINNGYNDVAVLVITDPNGVVTYQLLSSSEQTGINVNGATVDATGTVNYTPAITGQYQFSWLVLNAIDGNNDSQLSVGAPKISYNGNSYGAPITFPINVLPVGDETIGLITISGLPLSGVGFSFIGSNGDAVGTNLGGGSWSFTESQLSSLQLLTPPDYVGTMNLTVSAVGTENGIDATATQNISIEVAATTINIMGTQTGNTLTGSAANDLIDGLGGNDTIDGGSGNDILSGGAGNDNLSGGLGNDLLMGGSGNDTLNGGAGNDTLIGGAGNDTMTGGLGADVFKWELADKGAVGTPAADIVTDFDVASRIAGGDVLDLRDILTGENHTTGTGNLTNYLHFEKSGANTIVHISDSGAYAGGFNSANDVQIVTLQNVDLIGSFTNDQQVIADLLSKQKLVTD